MEDLLKKINEFFLSISPDIYFDIIGGVSGLILSILIIMKIYDFFEKFGEKFDTTPLDAFFIILTSPITIPIVIIWGIVESVYIFLKPHLRELLFIIIGLFKELSFLIIGLFKMLIRIVGDIIQLGKENTPNLEIKTLILVGAIKTLEDELAESKTKRKELLDSVSASLGGSFDISYLHIALIIWLHTVFEHQGFDKGLLSNHAVKSTLEASAGRIHDLLMNDLSPKEDQFDDDIPF